MINNRQAGRRRGRNNSRPQGNGRGGDQGNRIDSRARGNAAQLLEKYKNLARDAQTQGDRVNAEYFLQFADHYFRVLADNRARQEEQQSWRRNRDDNRFDLDDEEELGMDGDLETGAVEAQPYPQQRAQSEERRTEGWHDRSNDHQSEHSGGRQYERQNDRGFRRPRRGRDEVPVAPVEAEAPAVVDAVEPQPQSMVEESAPKPKRAPRQKRSPKVDAADESQAIDAAILPPSISRADNDSGEEVAPRKRTRRPRQAAEAAE